MSVAKEVAPSGKLRVGINYSNFLIVSKDAPDGSPRGIAPDLGRELGKRLGVPVEFVRYDAAGKLAEGVRGNEWDVAFLGNEPQRASEISFSPAYLEIPVTYVVPAGSPIRTLEDVDKPGVRVAVSAKSAYDLFLTRHLKHAQLVRAEGIPASYRAFAEQKLEALGGLKPGLVGEVQKHPGARVLDGQVTAVQQSAGMPQGRTAGAKALAEFITEAKKSGLVAKLIAQYEAKGVNVAP
jgi:polar amino acid transport system substrate-binding protein